MRSLNLPLRLLTENEIFRLSVWGNPTNDAKKGGDLVGNTERTLLDVSDVIVGDETCWYFFQASWTPIVRTLWDLDPAIAVYLTERSNNATIRYEVGKLVRSNTIDVLDIPEALTFLVGERLDPLICKELKVPYSQNFVRPLLTHTTQYLLLWAPVPPIVANTFFERRFNSDPLILQYAHRVLAQHPVELTFFFIPQVVQALRYDDLGENRFQNVCPTLLIIVEGYVARFIFETAKISQLFCHQIIWNMKANCYKDDAAEIVRILNTFGCIALTVWCRKILWNQCSIWWRLRLYLRYRGLPGHFTTENFRSSMK